jgi:predicted Rossmann fold flavoprotein
MQKRRIVVVGGGAAGFFAAITAAEANPAGCDVILLEATAHLLAKVKVSGGGRCNVTHACFEPRELVKRYPRGSRELMGPFHRWQPRDTIAWFAARGVELKTESDGRMFPTTDDSGTIVQCLMAAAQKAGVHIRTQCSLREIERTAAGFALRVSGDENLLCDRVLFATGGNKASAAFSAAIKLGHSIAEQVPSLFTFHIEDSRLKELPGLSVPHAVASVRGSRLKEEGPVLITHWGLSGPAILKLSAWGARELHALDYRFTLQLSWVPNRSRDQVREDLAAARAANPRRQVTTWNPFNVPQRLWERLVMSAGIAGSTVWTSVSNQALSALAAELVGAEFAVTGKSMNKEEFVTCGGVTLNEVDFKTMQSRLCPGLFFAGEVLDIDGITGGFNFQAAWTTGWLAGHAMAAEERSQETGVS